MMKKIISTFILVVLLVINFSFVHVNNQANAQFLSTEDYKNDLKNILFDFMYEESEEIRIDRSAGSVGELEAAIYIRDFMLASADTFIPYEAENEGIQTFSFVDLMGKLNYSQNVIFTKKGSGEGKIIISTPYDNMYGSTLNSKSKVESTGLNSSLSGVVTLLKIAKEINKIENDLPYDIEIIFFGAEKSYLAGSKNYTLKMNSEVAADVLLMISLNDLMYGSTFNVFASDKKNKLTSYITDSMNLITNNNYFNQFNPGFNITNLSSVNTLPYYHAGMSSNANFTDLSIKSINIFGGDYGVLPMYNESDLLNDNYDYAIEKYGEKFIDNLEVVSSAIVSYISRSETKSELISITDNVKYSAFWTDKRIPLTITLVTIFIITIIYFSFKDKLTIKFLTAMSNKETRVLNVQDIFDSLTKEIENKNLSKEEINKRLNKIIREKIEGGATGVSSSSASGNASGLSSNSATRSASDNSSGVSSGGASGGAVGNVSGNAVSETSNKSAIVPAGEIDEGEDKKNKDNNQGA